MKIAARRKQARKENEIKLGLYYERHPGERPIKKDFAKRNQAEGTVFTPEPIEGSVPQESVQDTPDSVAFNEISEFHDTQKGKERK